MTALVNIYENCGANFAAWRITKPWRAQLAFGEVFVGNASKHTEHLLRQEKAAALSIQRRALSGMPFLHPLPLFSFNLFIL
jgi:hypothetical protein